MRTFHSACAILRVASVLVLSSALGTACSSTIEQPFGDGEGGDDGNGGDDGEGGESTPAKGSGGKTGGTGGKGSGGTKTGTGGKQAAGDKGTGGKQTAGDKGTGGKLGSGGTKEKDGGAGGTKGTGGKAPGTGGVKGTGGVNEGTGGKPEGAAGNAGGGSTTPDAGGGGTTGPAAQFKCGIPAVGSGGKAKPSGTAGNLKVLDWAGFKSAVSYTFDDANSSQINNYKAMNEAGGKYTFFLQTGKSEAGNAIWKTALQDGHELGNHTKSHSQNYNEADAQAAQDFIKQTFGVTALSFAAPNGTSNWQSVSPKFFLNRSVNGGSVGANDSTNPGWLPSNIPGSLGASAGKWQIYCIHGFTGGSDSAYQPIALSSFTSAVKQDIQNGAWVDTMANIGAYWAGQKAFPKSATNNKWTWTKPKIFPEGKCLRVTVDGGTLTQDGKVLPWDEHGYYEVSLDAQSLELSN